jgi:rhamnogalacturonan endolyase
MSLVPFRFGLRALPRVLACFTLVCSLFTVSPSRLFANQPGGFVSTVTTPVTTGTVTYRSKTARYLDNGIIRAIVSASGNVQSLRYLKPGLPGTPAANGVEMVSQSGSSNSNFGNHTEIYYYWFPDGTAGTAHHASTGDAARRSLVYRRPYTPATHKLPMDVELHYTLGRGETMLYVHAVIDHPANYPQADLNFIQMIWPVAHGSTDFLCENLYIDDTVKLGLSLNGNRLRRNSLEPNYLDTSKGVTVPGLPGEINRLTSGPFNGQLTGKYSYNIAYHRYGTWGRASEVNDVGQWVVVGSHESGNNGPTRREYVHGWGLVYHQPISNHYSNRTVSVPAGSAWTKVIGPWGLYFNGLPTGTAAWADAQAQAEAEKAAWPYAWVTHAAYQPQAQRATLTGRITLSDTLRPAVAAAHAWVGLAAPDSGLSNATDNWQFQADRYQYWVRAAADGSFTIPDIQTTSTYGGGPETYRLTVYSEGATAGTGAVEEFQLGDHTFTPGESRNLGVVPLTVPRQAGDLLWEIGIPDRSAGEFRHGDEYATPALWLNYVNEFTNPLNYDVASGTWATALNFSHTLDYVGPDPWKWNLNFTLPSVSPGTYWLTIAYASADSVQIIRVNDDAIFAAFTPPNARPGASSFLRQSVQTKYSYLRVGIPATRLRAGANTISLDHEVHTNRATAGFMYDYLSLEAPAPVVLPPGRDLVWQGGVSANAWDRTAANWRVSGTASPAVVFVDGDRPVFDNTGSASPSVTLAPAVSPGEPDALRPGRITFSNTTARAHTVAGQGVLAGPFQLLKTGNGALTVSPHHQSVVASIVGGSPLVTVASVTGLFPGLTYVSSSAAHDFPAGTVISSIDAANLRLTLSANAFTTRNNISLGFGAAHTFSGGTVLDAGTVTLANATANVAGLGSGPLTLNGGTVQMWDNQSTTHLARWDVVVPLGASGRLNASSRVDLSGSVSGGGEFTFYVPFIRTTLTGSWANFTGRILVRTDATGGDLRLGNAAGCPTAALDLGPLVTAYSTLSGNVSLPVGELSGSSTAKLSGAGTGITTWVVGSLHSDATFAGSVANGTSPATTALTKVGAGTWTLSGANTYSGPTTVSAGTLVVSGSVAGASLNVAPEGTLSVTGSVTLSGDTANDGLIDLASGSTFSVAGGLLNRGTLILRGNTALSVSGSFLNEGSIDILTATSALPANLVNQGVIIDASAASLADFQLVDGVALVSIVAYPGHSYRLQRRDSLSSGAWLDIGLPQTTDAPDLLTFTDAANSAVPSRFYRITIGP